MEALQAKAKELLAQGRVKAVLGFEVGTEGALRPCFARKAEDAGRLVWKGDEEGGNLAAYVTRRETRALGPVAVAGGPALVRSLLQLTAEKQLRDGEVLALLLRDGAVTELATQEDLEAAAAQLPRGLSEADRELMARLSAMDRRERWAYWQQELARCVKCYACRASCPMCYCAQCTMDCNRPQWVPVPAHAIGNLEYHAVRAMHLAGRCVQCGACGRACPAGIPVHLLTFFAEDSTARQFGQRAGASARLDYALGTFRPDDKETFIR